MCMEDIRIARKTWVRQSTINVGADNIYHVASDAKRVGIFASNINGGIPLVFMAGNVGPNQLTGGFAFISTLSVFGHMLRIEEYGQLITGDISIYDTNLAGNPLTLTELILTEE